MTAPTKPKANTARERALEVLREHPGGLSKSELRKEIGGNAGAFRRLIQSMEDKDEITITPEHRPTCGLTKVIRAA
jgi:DNA-binding IclR family transcriptional regulator